MNNNNTSLLSVDILLVDDNPGDVRLTQEALKESTIPCRFFVAHDGKEALHFLRKQGEYANAVRPDIILLDLNLPGKGGHDVLAEIKSEEDLKSIPLVVLSISNLEFDVQLAYARHANCFISKPIDFDEFQAVVRKIEDFWFATVKLPQKGEKS